MKKIKMHNADCFALIDDEDYEYLNQFKWSINSRGYVTRTERREGRRYTTTQMHREIMNTPKGLVVDHWDHNGLNNQKSNLRNCTYKENSQNSKKFFMNNHATDKERRIYEQDEERWKEIKKRRNMKHQRQCLEYRMKKLYKNITELKELINEIDEYLLIPIEPTISDVAPHIRGDAPGLKK